MNQHCYVNYCLSLSVLPTVIFTLELEERTKREEILDAVILIHLTVQDGARYADDDENQLVLREPNIGTQLVMTIWSLKRSSRTCTLICFERLGQIQMSRSNLSWLVETTIQSVYPYSRLGNNDYPFGRINDKPIRNQRMVCMSASTVYTRILISLCTKRISRTLQSIYQRIPRRKK